MIPIGPDMLAQEDGGGWHNLIYVLVVVVLPMLSRLGAKIRKKFGRGDQESETLALEVPLPPKQKRRPTRPDRVHQAVDTEAALTAKPAPTPPIPQARPSRPRLQTATAPPPARPIEPQRRPKPAEAERATARPLQARIAAMLTEKKDVSSGWLEQERKQAAAKKKRSPQPSAKASSTKLVLPNIITAGDLRAAVILSEILRPPLALREPNES